MKTNTLLYVAAAFAAGYYANKLYAGEPKVGASWNCQRNPNAPGCQGGQSIHTVILPFPAKASWNCQKNPFAPGCNGNAQLNKARVAGI